MSKAVVGKKKAAAARKVTGGGSRASRPLSQAGTKRVKQATATSAKGSPLQRAGEAKKAVAKRAPAATPGRDHGGVSHAAMTAVEAQTLAHGLNSLLHTMHEVQQHEEHLCSLMHALRGGRPSRALLRDLRTVLEHLPAHEYLYEVDSIRSTVAAG